MQNRARVAAHIAERLARHTLVQDEFVRLRAEKRGQPREQERREEGRLLLRLKGRFDREAARELVRRLEAAGPRPMLLDFTGVERVEDASLSLLAESLRGRGAAVSLSGLSGHHRRLLAYLCTDDQPSP